MKKVAVIMGSKSDWPVVQRAVKQLKDLGIEFEAHIFSAHRTPEEAMKFAQTARQNNFGVIIAAAGMAAHLAGSMAAATTLPVIGIPLKSGDLGGVDALLSTVMMPPGIPVGVVGVGAARNAALLAAEILAIDDKELSEKLQTLRNENSKNVLGTDRQLQEEISHLE